MNKKSLGQNFLSNPSLADKIVRVANIQAGDSVLEIGPGRGILTAALSRAGGIVTAIEKDGDLIPFLHKKFESNKDVTIIEGDALTFTGSETKVVANLPYNIATEIIFRLLDHKKCYTDFYLMVQKEVGERLVAQPGTKKFGILSVLTQIHADTKIVLKLAPTAFIPRPKVQSVIVHFKLLPELRFPVNDFSFFRNLVQASFGSRRKQLKNSLADHLAEKQKLKTSLSTSAIEAAMKELGIKTTSRAEQVSIDQFVALAGILKKYG